MLWAPYPSHLCWKLRPKPGLPLSEQGEWPGCLTPVGHTYWCSGVTLDSAFRNHS